LGDEKIVQWQFEIPDQRWKIVVVSQMPFLRKTSPIAGFSPTIQMPWMSKNF
jgi:hypothetical protein